MGALTSAQNIMVRLYLLGGPQYRAEMIKAGLATKEMTGATTRLGLAMEKTTKRSFLQNQAMFTARRGLFYTTLAAAGLTAEVIRMGFAYNNAMESASVALQQVIKPQTVLNSEMQKLFLLAAGTPFQIKDITLAFRQMFISFKPFHVGLSTINDTITAITDNLSATGKVTPAALSRVSIALSHMANIGHLTGQAVQQLARDGLQLQPALRKELHLSTDQLSNLGKAGISARDVLIALIKYSKTTPGIMGAAQRQADYTLSGAFTSFKDYVSQAAGGAMGGPSGSKGIFGFVQKDIVGINTQLSKMARGGKPVGLWDIAQAIDKQITPHTHVLLNLFVLFRAAIQSLITVFGLLFKALMLIIWPFAELLNIFGISTKAAKVLGWAVGILAALVLIGAARWLAYRAAVDIAKASLWGLGKAIGKTINLQKTLDAYKGIGGIRGIPGAAKGGIASWRTWANAMKGPNISGTLLESEGAAGVTTGFANTGLIAKMSRAIFGLGRNTPAIKALTTAVRGLQAAFRDNGIIGALRYMGTGIKFLISGIPKLVMWLWRVVSVQVVIDILSSWWLWIPIAIAAVILVLVLLYRKWQGFRDVVDSFFAFFKKNWIYFTLLLGVVVFAVVEIVKHWKFFLGIINSVINAIKNLIHWIGKIPFVHSIFHAIGSAAHWITSSSTHAQHRALGGPVVNTGPVLVGERGPEVVLLPGGSNVIPNNQLNRVQPVDYNRGGGGNDRPIVVQVMLDRKVLAEGVARANQDYAARR